MAKGLVTLDVWSDIVVARMDCCIGFFAHFWTGDTQSLVILKFISPKLKVGIFRFFNNCCLKDFFSSQ